MIRADESLAGEIALQQWMTSPAVYLDHWALRRISEDAALSKRFLASLTAAGGTLAFSWLNCAEFSAMTDVNQAGAAERLLLAANPHLFLIESTPTLVIEREDGLLRGGKPLAPHSDNESLAVHCRMGDRGEALIAVQGVLSLAMNPGTRGGFDRLRDTLVERVEALRQEMLTNPEFRRSARRLPRGPAVQRGTRWIFRELIRTLLVDPGKAISRRDAADLLHAIVPVSYCDYVLLDKHWEVQVERVRARLRRANLPIPIAEVFSETADGLERFLTRLEGRNHTTM